MSNLDMARFCVLTAPFLHHTLEYGLDSIAANGFSSIELWGASPHYCLDDYDQAGREQRVREICAMLSSRGLSMAVYHPEQIRQYPVNIASPSAYIQTQSMDFMRRCLEDTAAFGAPIMMLTPGWVFVNDFTEADTLRAIQAVQQLAEYAKPLGVRLAMEEQDPTVSLLCSTLPRLSRLVKETGVEACMDIPLGWNTERMWTPITKLSGTWRMCIFPTRTAPRWARAIWTWTASLPGWMRTATRERSASPSGGPCIIRTRTPRCAPAATGCLRRKEK